MITGHDLQALGYRPAPWFKAVLAYANTHQLRGGALRQYVEQVRPRLMNPHPQPVPLHENIRAEAPEELANVAAVTGAMRELLVTPTLREGALMPDACPTGPGQIPVGGIAVAHNALHPAMHSADICCSVMMSSFAHLSPKALLDAAHATTHFGGGGRAEFSELPAELEEHISGNTYLAPLLGICLLYTSPSPRD